MEELSVVFVADRPVRLLPGTVVVRLQVDDEVRDLLRIDPVDHVVIVVVQVLVVVQLVLEEHVPRDDGLQQVDILRPLAEHDAVGAGPHHVHLLRLEHLVPGGVARVAVREDGQRDAPEPADEMVDHVRAGHAAAADDPLAVPREEMRREDEGVPAARVQQGAEEALGTVEDAVELDGGIAVLAPPAGREHRVEAVLPPQGRALVAPAHRIAAALENGRAEPRATVLQRPAEVAQVVVEFAVDLPEGHGVNDHR